MKRITRLIQILSVALFFCLTITVSAQTSEHRVMYNDAVEYYSRGDYSSCVNLLSRFMTPMEDNPSAWVDAGYTEFIFRVYKLAGASYYNSGDSSSADIIVDNLIYVLSDYYYESDIINSYNSTQISKYF